MSMQGGLVVVVVGAWVVVVVGAWVVVVVGAWVVVVVGAWVVVQSTKSIAHSLTAVNTPHLVFDLRIPLLILT